MTLPLLKNPPGHLKKNLTMADRSRDTAPPRGVQLTLSLYDRPFVAFSDKSLRKIAIIQSIFANTIREPVLCSRAGSASRVCDIFAACLFVVLFFSLSIILCVLNVGLQRKPI